MCSTGDPVNVGDAGAACDIPQGNDGSGVGRAALWGRQHRLLRLDGIGDGVSPALLWTGFQNRLEERLSVLTDALALDAIDHLKSIIRKAVIVIAQFAGSDG